MRIFIQSLSIVIIALATQSGLFAQQDYLKGKLLQQHDSVPIPNAHIINISQSRGTITHLDGVFTISAQTGDIILLQALGFFSDTIIVDQNMEKQPGENIFTLQRRVYELSEVKIYPYATFAEFKQAFINFDNSKLEPEFKLVLPDVNYANIPETSGGVIIKGPITALYNTYSRRGKQIAKYNELLARESVECQISKKYNPTIVSGLTKIQDPEELRKFMEFCKLNETFILNAKEFELYSAIYECFKEYMAMNKP